MAKTRRRRSFNTPRKRRMRADWVYRSHAYGPFNEALDLLGTYEEDVVSQSSGIANAQSHVLYDSRDYIATQGTQGANFLADLPAYIGPAGRAEGRNPTILRTEGIIYVEPSTWALGNLIAWGGRIGAFEQDGTGVFSLDAAYSMWVNETTSTFQQVGHWANNGRGNAWERRVHYGFSDNQQFVVIRVKWNGRRILKPNECWGLFTELESTSVTTRSQYWLRTLVSDES